jgi:hypothetical protein
MKENNDKPLTSISKANTMEEIANFWETHSLTDYWEQTHEVEFEVKAQRRQHITLVPKLDAQVEKETLVKTTSPFDIEGININITTDEIVECIREGRECRNYG